MVLNSRSRHLYFSTRVCAPGEEFSRCVSNRANIIRVKIGLGYIGAPEIVPFEYGEPCYLFFDGDHLLSASLKEAFVRRYSIIDAALLQNLIGVSPR